MLTCDSAIRCLFLKGHLDEVDVHMMDCEEESAHEQVRRRLTFMRAYLLVQI